MGRKHWLPAVFARVNRLTRTPVVATGVVSVLVLVMALWLPIETLAKATSYFLLMVFALVNLALWRLKREVAHPPGIIRIPFWVPVTGFFASAAFVVIQGLIDLLN
jgi:amino acid transporter